VDLGKFSPNSDHVSQRCYAPFGQSGEQAGVSRSNDLVNRTLDALERLMRMFAFERFLYLACSVVSFVVLIVCLIGMLRNGTVSSLELAGIFGATGIVAASAARVSFFLNKSFNLISSIIGQLAGLQEKP
jgi:hypothetical protein